MEIYTILYILIAAFAFLFVGLVLISFQHKLKRKELVYRYNHDRLLIQFADNILYNTMCKSMDVIPEKIIEAKKAIEGDGPAH